ncbi:hypothetical protein [Burkholderia cepacia]|uniref:hypothetical protein n=1 Tax=Burkholderia cepacia TaxID=292 RepID=UPI001E38AE08|nr:hypothetical protein [Burkholderia cepacia]
MMLAVLLPMPVESDVTDCAVLVDSVAIELAVPVDRLPIVWAVDVDRDANPSAVVVDKLATVVSMPARPVESEPMPEAVPLDRLVILAVLLPMPVESDVTDCDVFVDSVAIELAIPVERLPIVWAVNVDRDANPPTVLVDKFATVVSMPTRPVESEPIPEAVPLDRVVILALFVATPVDSDATDCAAVVDSAASPVDMPAMPVTLLAVVVDSEFTD